MQKRGGTIARESRGEREEELALFHEVRRREHEWKSNAVHPLPTHDADLVGSSYTFMQYQKAPSTTKSPLTQTSICDPLQSSIYDPLPADLNKKDDDLLIAELGKNDYDWLLTPPGTPLTNSLDLNSAANGDDFLSRAAPFNSGRTLAAIKTSRVSSTKAEPSATLSTKPELALKRGQNGLTRSNGSTNSSSYTSNPGTPTRNKKTPLTPSSRSSSRPTSPTKRPISSAYTFQQATPTSRSKSFSAPGSHPTTPTSRPATALSSRSGSSSVSSTSMMTRKMGSSSPAMMPMRRLSGPQTPLSAGVSKSFSASKARPVPSRSMPSSRGSSPTSTAFEWHEAMDTPAFFSESESLRTSLTVDSYAKTSPSNPQSIKSRGSPVGSLSGEGGRCLATQAVFSSSNQTATSSDVSRKACSPRGTIAKSALLGISRTERQSSNRLLTSSVQIDKSHYTVARNAKNVDKLILHSRRSLGLSPSPSSEITRSALQPKHLLAKSATPSSSRDLGGFNKQDPRRSLGLTMQHMSLHEGATNGLCPLVSSRSLLNSRHTETQSCRINLAGVSNGHTSADYSTITSFEQDGSSEVGEEFLYESNFLESPASHSDHLSSLVTDARINNWLGSQDYMDDHQMQAQNDRLEKCESPLVCPHGGGGVANCDLCNVKMRLQMLNEKSKANFGAQILGEA